MATDDTRSNRSTQPESPAEGRIEAPRSTSARQALQPKPKQVYPPGPPGKVLIFRTLHGRVVPMWVDP